MELQEVVQGVAVLAVEVGSEAAAKTWSRFVAETVLETELEVVFELAVWFTSGAMFAVVLDAAAEVTVVAELIVAVEVTVLLVVELAMVNEAVYKVHATAQCSCQ